MKDRGMRNCLGGLTSLGRTRADLTVLVLGVAVFLAGGVLEAQTPALRFDDAQNEWVESTTSGLLDDASEATLEMWIYTDSQWWDGGSWRNIAGVTSGTGSTSGDDFLWGFHRQSGGNDIGLRVNGATPGDEYDARGYDDQWVHLAGVFDNGTVVTYVNGEEVAQYETDDTFDAVNNKFFLSSTSSAYSTGARGFVGMMSDVRLWEVARSQAEIASAIDSRLTGDENGLLLYWPLDEGDGTSVNDLSGRGNNGTITGAEWVEVDALPFTHQIVEMPPSPRVSISPGGSGELGPVLLHEDYEADATFQWYFDGEELDGETSAGLFIDDALVEQAGTYTVVVNHPDLDQPVEFDILVRVFEAQAPAAGLAGLAAAGGLLVFSGAASVRRKRR